VRVQQQGPEQRGKDAHQIALLPATGTPPRLLDQRLQLGDALLQVSIAPRLGPARRCGDGHGDSFRHNDDICASSLLELY
jgi:hypothetical protein